MPVIPLRAARTVLNTLYKSCQRQSLHGTSAPNDSGTEGEMQLKKRQRAIVERHRLRGEKTGRDKETKSNKRRVSRLVVLDKAEACILTHMDSESGEDKSNSLLLYALVHHSHG